MKTMLKNFFLFLAALLLIAGLLAVVDFKKEATPAVDLSTLVSQMKNNEVREIEIKGDNLNIILQNGQKETAAKESGEALTAILKDYGVEGEKIQAVKIMVKQETGAFYWLGNILPILIPFLLIGAVVYFMMRQVQGANTRAMSFGDSRAKEITANDKEKVTFKDVAGVKEAKEELKEVVDFLKNPKKFTDLGAKIPKGVLLMGAPGTGKTLLARAVSGEAGVPFFNISGSEFVEMFVGVGAARVRDLFRRAKKAAPCIVFVDEIDAVGRQRGSGLGGSHDEREQTLNQILVEMDGFDPNVGIIVVAATNRPDILDPALLRPGRFDRRIILDEPDLKDREEILKIHGRGKPIAKEVSLHAVAERTPGFSGADLANLMNEAAIVAARHNKKQVSQEDLLSSIEKVLLGPERKSHILTVKERKITAYHEAGHALSAHELPEADPVRKVSIVARGRAAGYTLKLPVEDRHLYSRAHFIDELAAMLGGFVAEKLVFGDVTTGASNDLKMATNLARRLVMEYGMSDRLGPRTFGAHGEMIFLGREITEQRNYSEEKAEIIDKEIDKLIGDARTTAEKLLTTKRASLDKIAESLLEKETLEQKEFEDLFA
ncbi:MAG: ATP-dependent zinc metalloprotease FtsH [bacterium]|nr:ATP-dependent zinc metalloprotease FtsH [bacterium]